MASITGIKGKSPLAYPTSPGAGGGPGASVPPFSSLKYVDSGTAVPVGQQDGSDAKPYSTIQQAIDASGGFAQVQLGSINNPSSINLPDGALLSVQASVPTFLGDITVGIGSTLVLMQCIAPSLTVAQTANVSMSFSQISGTTTLGNDVSADLFNSLLGDVILGSRDTISCFGASQIGGVTQSDPGNEGGNLILIGSTSQSSGSNTTTERLVLTGVINAPNYGIAVSGYQLAHDVTAFTLRASECTHTGNITTTDADAITDTLHIENPIQSAGSTWTAAGRATLKGCETPATLTIANAGQLVVDSYTNYWIKTNGTTVTNAPGKLVAADNVP